MTIIETISLITLVGASFMAGYKIGTSQKNKNPRLTRRGFSIQPSRLFTGSPDFGAFFFAQLPGSLLLTRKRVFILFQASFVLKHIFQFLVFDIIGDCLFIQSNS